MTGKRAKGHGALLRAVADALNACDSAGIGVKLRHGIVMTHAGYVLPGARSWVARTLIYTEFTPATDEEDDD